MWTQHLEKWGSIDPLDPVAPRPLEPFPVDSDTQTELYLITDVQPVKDVTPHVSMMLLTPNVNNFRATGI